MFESPQRNQYENRIENITDTELIHLTKRAIAVNSQHSLDMQQFVDVYGHEKIHADYTRVAEKISKRKRVMSSGEKLGHIFEAAFLDLASKNFWFGERSELVKASKYDDEMNGIDMITTTVDQSNTARHFEVASDLTISKHGLMSKLMRIKNDVAQDKLAQINYFHSDLIGFTGKLSNVPRTVVALDHTNMTMFLRRWLQEPDLSQEQIGKLITKQISIQSRGFAWWAKQNIGTNSRAYEKYMTTHQTSEEILANLEDIEMPHDSTIDTLERFAQSMKNPD
jgi:hypothetical protein